MKIRYKSLLAVIFAILPHTSFADIKLSDVFTFKADMRTGYFASEREDRDNSKSDSEEWRLRLRLGLKAKVNNDLSFKIRVSGRYSTDDRNDNYFKFFDASPSGDGLKRGQSTVDQLYVDFKLSDWKLRVGRQQTNYELAGVAKKTLDRNDSPNTDINWTDGLFAKRKGANGWDTDIIVQFNPKQGSTNVRRSPLNFTDSGSRFSYFVSYGSKKKAGNVIQRALDFNYLPSSLRKDGSATGPLKDYYAFVGRLAISWPVGTSGTKFILGLEAGYAPETPTLASKSLSGSGDTNGFAGQITFNFVNFVPRHSAGLVVGRAGAGYLISPDFRNNNDLIELRYKWQMNKKQKLEARIRQRTEIERLTTAADKRVDTDFYLRFTHKF